jgi:hypothetical protein
MFSRVKRFRGILIVSGLILFLMGCPSVPLAPQDIDVAAKHFEPQEGKVNIYVTRTSIVGSGALYSLGLDGKPRGSIAYDTYFLFELDPGTHTVVVRWSRYSDAVTLHTEAGHNYFLAVGGTFSMRGTFFGETGDRPWIEPLDDEEGREAVLETSLAQHN